MQRLPLNSLKIDRSFISATQPSRPLAEVIIALGHTLGLRVVAEGVETQEHLDWLRHTDCDEFQGFLYSAAVPADAFEALVTGPR
ncbi:MAG: EAL domain-containing protein [Rhodanobacteraceae bacterium]|nr:EAL domain-containing protein [Rhodanobacteraceae bacterium]